MGKPWIPKLIKLLILNGDLHLYTDQNWGLISLQLIALRKGYGKPAGLSTGWTWGLSQGGLEMRQLGWAGCPWVGGTISWFHRSFPEAASAVCNSAMQLLLAAGAFFHTPFLDLGGCFFENPTKMGSHSEGVLEQLVMSQLCLKLAYLGLDERTEHVAPWELQLLSVLVMWSLFSYLLAKTRLKRQDSPQLGATK